MNNDNFGKLEAEYNKHYMPYEDDCECEAETRDMCICGEIK